MRALLTIIVIILVIIIGAVIIQHASPNALNQTNLISSSTSLFSSTTTSTSSTTNTTSTTSGSTSASASSSGNSGATTTSVTTISDGTIAVAVPSDFGIATDPSQITVRSYIPSCDQGFNYCLFYNGNRYAGTNFEAAGIGITRRTDLTTESQCLNAAPAGYSTSTVPSSTKSYSPYSVSVFRNLSDAAAGHMGNGSLYRLFVRVNSNCYEFMNRVIETQYQNYPAGTVKQFTTSDRNALMARMDQILEGIKLGTSKNLFASL